MELNLPADLQTKLTQLNAHEGKNSEALAVEAIERLVAYDEWFLAKVKEGEEAADRGDVLDHEAVRVTIDSRYSR